MFCGTRCSTETLILELPKRYFFLIMRGTEFEGPENDGPRKIVTEKCNTWKVKDQIAPWHLNIIIIYSSDGTATTV